MRPGVQEGGSNARLARCYVKQAAAWGEERAARAGRQPLGRAETEASGEAEGAAGSSEVEKDGERVIQYWWTYLFLFVQRTNRSVKISGFDADAFAARGPACLLCGPLERLKR